MNYTENLFFSMDMDIYYSTENQDKFGKDVSTWTLDRTIIGYAEILGPVEKDGLKADQFFEYQGKLIGRAKEDPRTSLEGLNYSINNIIITNICGHSGGQEFYTESYGDRSGLSTIFEIMAVEPYVNPWNEIEYYKIMFNRSDKQLIFSD